MDMYDLLGIVDGDIPTFCRQSARALSLAFLDRIQKRFNVEILFPMMILLPGFKTK